MSKTIYLANPYGFSEQWKERLLPEIVDPRSKVSDWKSGSRSRATIRWTSRSPGWAHQVGQGGLRRRPRLGRHLRRRQRRPAG